MAPHCRLTERIRAFIATCLAWSPNLPCDYKGLQLVGELLSLGGETLKQAVGDLHERQLEPHRPVRDMACRPMRSFVGTPLVSATFILFVPLLGYAERREARSKQLPSTAMQSVGR